jgi:eukaryotic-like serine/threonine-protein kinase
VEEVRAAGTSSVEDLLDSGQLRRLAKVAAEAENKGAGEGAQKVALATRDEVEAYERKLRRQKWGAYLSAVTFVAILGGAAVKIIQLETRTKAFAGVEVEPNNTPAEATRMPFGRTATGYLGKRLDPGHGDRDFYAVDVPSIPGENPPTLSTVRLRVTALPNFAMCTMIYRQGLSTALGQYCVGRPSKDLVIPALRLEPGRYLVAVMQDLDPYGTLAPFIHENVSDPYTLTVEPSTGGPAAEIEPNDQVASANRVAPGGAITGTIAWARDEDLYCVAPDTAGAVRWKVRTEPRAGGAVIEATPMRGAQDGAPVRVHAGMGKLTATDVQTPWTSGPVGPDEGGAPRCLRVRLTNDPWAGAQSAIVPSGGSEPYVVEVEAVP